MKPRIKINEPLFIFGIVNVVCQWFAEVDIKFIAKFPFYLALIISFILLLDDKMPKYHEYADAYDNYVAKIKDRKLRYNTAITAITMTLCVSASISLALSKDVIIGILSAVQWMSIHFVVSGSIVWMIYKAIVCIIDSETSFISRDYISKRDWLVKSCAILSILIMTNSGSLGFFFREMLHDKLIGFVIDDLIITAASAILAAIYIHLMLMLIQVDGRINILKSMEVIITSAALLHISTGYVSAVGRLNGPMKQLSLILLFPQSYLVFVSIFRWVFWKINVSKTNIFCDELCADNKIETSPNGAGLR